VTLPRASVVYTTDQRYWPHVFVSLYSLLINNRDRSFDVFIFAAERDPAFFEHAAFLSSHHPDVKVNFVRVDDREFAGAPVGSFTIISYYRLLIGRLLPEAVRRVLYLDADTIVRGSIGELLELDLEGHVLAATPEEVPVDKVSGFGPHPVRLGLPEDTPYFNAGVLLVDLDCWRRTNVEQRCLTKIRQLCAGAERLSFAEQDILNLVLSSEWKALGPSYNYQDWSINSRPRDRFDPDAMLGGIVPPEGPIIAHLTGASLRPWEGISAHPYASDYWHYRMQTPYADRVLYVRRLVTGPVRTLRNRVVGLARRHRAGRSLLRFAKQVSGRAS
jgi:lipopolysaccharide biosynthesis glycosyltransferase